MSTEINDQIQQAIREIKITNAAWFLTTFTSKNPSDIIRWSEFAVGYGCAVAVGVKTPRLYAKCIGALQREGIPHDYLATVEGWRWLVFNRAACPAIERHALASKGIPRSRIRLYEAH